PNTRLPRDLSRAATFALFLVRRPPRSTLFPSTTLFRSAHAARPSHRRPAASRAGPPAAPAEANQLTHLPLRPGYAPQMDAPHPPDRKSTRLNSSHVKTSYAVFCLKKKTDDAAGTARRGE